MTVDEFNEAARSRGSKYASIARAQKAMLHEMMLRAMDDAGALDELVFQGGSCLSIAYGSPRLSDDLDFAAADDVIEGLRGSLGRVLEDGVKACVAAEVTVKSPKPKRDGSAVDLARWVVSVDLSPEDPSAPRERVKLEVAGVPVHDERVELLSGAFFDRGPQMGIPVLVESKSELLADKLVSFTHSRYPRYRDAWDIAWLSQDIPSLEGVLGMVEAKLGDYGYESDGEAFSAARDDLHEVLEAPGFLAVSEQLPSEVAKRTVLSARWRRGAQARLAYLLSAAAGRLEGGSAEAPSIDALAFHDERDVEGKVEGLGPR